ncbi:YgfZ/GcvT domain-containing protein [Lampropedia aestuarii]|uniref:CAF17-like 4Fe-4S cluster assembly/insertion protein YgfZ n=1 Tax=Lampropedia aestuarii TaxID=2562762 RepID=UPI002468CF8E|nr:folate-binding protein [Lampropedia aestuarii]MDH5856855.1 folate-binding protein [Lampropedia aestuarii]
MTLSLHAITPVPELGVLHCAGPDTLTFLQGQLSNDFALMRHNQARLAAFLSAKGRMQASFIAVRYGPHDVLLLAHTSILAAVQKRLSMFVLRAKVKITDASAQWQLHGALGDAALSTLQALQDSTLEAAPVPWQCVSNSDAQAGLPSPEAGADASQAHAPSWAVALYPAAGLPRALLIQPQGAALPEAVAALADPAQAAELAQQWAWSEVAAGIATISAPVVDLFVPQMLNYESVGGVNFKKGCYPGQEVVARSQFRGAIKRRAFLAHGQAVNLPKAGDEIYSADDLEQPCGTVAQVALSASTLPHPIEANKPHAFDAIVSIKTDAAEQALLIRSAVAASDAEAPSERPEPTSPDIPVRLSKAPYPILEDL